MWLSGRPDGPPLGPPWGLVAKLEATAGLLDAAAQRLDAYVRVDPLELLGQRAAIRGLRRGGTTSCGGSTRLLRARDGWLATTLARPDDAALVAAWLELPSDPEDPWDAIRSAASAASADELTARGRVLGLPVAALPPAPPAGPLPHRLRPWTTQRVPGDAPVPMPVRDLRVVELASLWAGPLCGALLARAGAAVVKVESTSRPDGARRGAPAFFDLLNAGKRSVALDLGTREGRDGLRLLVERADVVIEGSRPRALAQLGIDAAAAVSSGPRVWASITGHGREGPASGWVGFGDDAAVAGGLVCWEGTQPRFCADAVADPIGGLVAATAVLEAVGSGGRHLIDVALARVASAFAGPPSRGQVPSSDIRLPSLPAPSAAGPALGGHTAVVLAELART
jgi:hypothetical protein